MSDGEQRRAQELTIQVEPGEEEWGTKDDDRWKRDLSDLRVRLEREMPDDVEPAYPKAGALGIELIPVLIALGSSGAFTAVVEVIKSWLHEKPGRRAITATVSGPDGVKTVTVTSDGVESGDLTEAFKSVAGEQSKAS